MEGFTDTSNKIPKDGMSGYIAYKSEGIPREAPFMRERKGEVFTLYGIVTVVSYCEIFNNGFIHKGTILETIAHGRICERRFEKEYKNRGLVIQAKKFAKDLSTYVRI